MFDVGVREDRRGLGIGTAMMGSIGSRTPLFVQMWLFVPERGVSVDPMAGVSVG